jgi:hypothetical protein
VTLEVVREAQQAGLDLLTLPSHTSHALQLLDVTVFKPFKTHFREYRNFWTSRNMHQKTTKETLVQWMSLGLKKALSVHNIKKGFETTRIWPLNRTTVDLKLMSSQNFVNVEGRNRDTLPAGLAVDFATTMEADAPPEAKSPQDCAEGDEDDADTFGAPEPEDYQDEVSGDV